MKLAAVDIQGFVLRAGEQNHEFYPKEVTIQTGFGWQDINHYLIKPPCSFQSLSVENKRQVRFMERNIHGVLYSSGSIEYNALKDIIKNHLSDVDLIYVRGHQKLEYLNKVLRGEDCSSTTIVNTENFDYFTDQPPIYQVEVSYCNNHISRGKIYRCSKKNCADLFNWVYNLLPQ